MAFGAEPGALWPGAPTTTVLPLTLTESPKASPHPPSNGVMAVRTQLAPLSMNTCAIPVPDPAAVAGKNGAPTTTVLVAPAPETATAKPNASPGAELVSPVSLAVSVHDP